MLISGHQTLCYGEQSLTLMRRATFRVSPSKLFSRSANSTLKNNYKRMKIPLKKMIIFIGQACLYLLCRWQRVFIQWLLRPSVSCNSPRKNNELNQIPTLPHIRKIPPTFSIKIFKQGDFLDFVMYFSQQSTLRHLTPSESQIGGWWDRAQECCDLGIGSQKITCYSSSHPLLMDHIKIIHQSGWDLQPASSMKYGNVHVSFKKENPRTYCTSGMPVSNANPQYYSKLSKVSQLFFSFEHHQGLQEPPNDYNHDPVLWIASD